MTRALEVSRDDRSRRWAVALYPVAWFAVYQAYVVVRVFGLGDWHPKFGGPWGTVRFLESLGVAAVGVPVLAYVAGVAVGWRWICALPARRIALASASAWGVHLALVGGRLALAGWIGPPTIPSTLVLLSAVPFALTVLLLWAVRTASPNDA